MRTYKKHIYITALISIVTFVLAILLHYLIPCSEADFWIDVCLGIFGGAVLTLITSIISYNHERRRTMESFVYHTSHILSYLSKYQESMSIEQKLNFYLDYIELDKSAWDMDFGNMDFIFEKVNNNRKYIYEKIYKPILDFTHAVLKHEWHFRWHLDGSGRNEAVMEGFLSELQGYLINKKEYKFPIENDENATEYCNCSSSTSKLVADIRKEINGHYFEIMYGKKAENQLKSQEEKENG